MRPRIYIAAPWSWRDAAQDVQTSAIEQGWECTARWMFVHGDSTDPEVLRREALNDIEDIQKARALVLLNIERSEGKSVELGYALALGLPVIVVGTYPGCTNIFLHHPFVTRVETFDQALDTLERRFTAGL